MTMKVARRESASQARRGGTLRTVRIKKRDSTGWRSGAEYVDIEIGWFRLVAKLPEEDNPWQRYPMVSWGHARSHFSAMRFYQMKLPMSP